MNESEFNKIAVVKISGMTCEGCAMNVNRALTSTEGVKDAKVDFSKKTAVIEYDAVQTDESRLKKVITQTGFEVENDPASTETTTQGLTKAKSPSRVPSNLRFAGILLAIAAITLIGYFTFRVTAPEIVMSSSSLSLLLFAVVAGVATFFNPCSFPLLPNYLTLYSSAASEQKKAGKTRAVSNGLIAGAGVVTFSLIVGALIGTLGTTFGQSLSVSSSEPNEFVLLFRGVVGATLVALGLSHFLGRGISFRFLSPLGSRFAPSKDAGQTKRLYLYGFGYNAIGIGCGGPILAGLAIFAFSAGGLASALLAFAVYSLTMAGLMIVISVIASSAQGELIKTLKKSTRRIQRITAIIQAVVGVLLILSIVYVDVYVGLFFPK